MSSKHVAAKQLAARWLAAGVLTASALALAACGTESAPELPSPAQVVPVTGSDIPRLELTPGAVQRLGIQTQPVTAAAPGTVEERSPEEARSTITAIQQGWERGRSLFDPREKTTDTMTGTQPPAEPSPAEAGEAGRQGDE